MRGIMRFSRMRTSLIVVFAEFWLLSCVSCRQTPGGKGAPEDLRQSFVSQTVWRVADVEAAHHLSEVLGEIRRLRNHPWAGRYLLGDRPDADRLALAPTSGFVLIAAKGESCCQGVSHGRVCSPDCPGAREAIFGDVLALKDDRIRLALELAPGNVILAGEYVPMVHGDRHYLVASDEVALFRQFTAPGGTAESESARRFFVRQPDP